MPCYRCGVRQTDPGRGQSPWKRGVVRHSQILICPGCQDAADWTAELDRCSRCSSVRLVKRLGEVECRDCGAIVAPEGAGEPEFADGPGGARPEGGSGAAGTDPEGAGLESAGLETGAAALICRRKSPGPWTGCSAGAWSARASSAPPIRRARRGRVPCLVGRALLHPGPGLGGPGRGGTGPPGMRTGITRRLIPARSGTGCPGRVPPGPVRTAWT